MHARAKGIRLHFHGSFFHLALLNSYEACAKQVAGELHNDREKNARYSAEVKWICSACLEQRRLVPVAEFIMVGVNYALRRIDEER